MQLPALMSDSARSGRGYSHKIVGWAMRDHLRAELPLAALTMAISAQRPGAGLIRHSDRAVQYASAEYRKLMQSAGFQVSMSRKADCYDNAPMESFFHTLKTELVHQAGEPFDLFSKYHA
jgi:putative transposase